MRISKIIKFLLNEKLYINMRKNEKKILKIHKEWKKLTKKEKKYVCRCNNNITKIIKNIYPNWKEVDSRYLVSDFYYQSILLPRLNNINFDNFNMVSGKSYFSDKNFQEKIVCSFKFARCILRRINGFYYDEKFNSIDLNQAIEKTNKYDKLVFKNTFGQGHGKGVSLEEKKNFKKALITNGENYVVQELIKQHGFLANFNESSVNIIRITSLLWKGKVYILSGVLRIGAPGAFCDHLGFGHNNPRIVALDDNGNLVGPAVDPERVIAYEDIFGKKVIGKVPYYDKMKQMICDEHLKFIHHSIIGWDITLNDNDEIICIEFNSNFPGVIQSQMVCGPIFARKTINNVALLDEIKEHYKL